MIQYALRINDLIRLADKELDSMSIHLTCGEIHNSVGIYSNARCFCTSAGDRHYQMHLSYLLVIYLRK